jgi:hypothetical protein
MTFYLHTLDDSPADFDGKQVCFCTRSRDACRLVTSLKQIRKEQKASSKWRIENGFRDDCEYGYQRVTTP